MKLQDVDSPQVSKFNFTKLWCCDWKDTWIQGQIIGVLVFSFSLIYRRMVLGNIVVFNSAFKCYVTKCMLFDLLGTLKMCSDRKQKIKLNDKLM